MTKSDWTLKYIQRQNPTRDDAERTKDNERHLCRDVPPPSGCRKKLKQMNGKKKLKSERHACVCRSSVCIEAAREDFFLKKNRWQGNGPAKSKLKASQVPNEPKKNVSHTPSTNLSPSKKKPSTNL